MKTISLGGQKSAVVLVDDEDYVSLNQYRWHISGRYVCRHELIGEREDPSKRGKIRMHSTLIKASDGFYVDHINRNRLDNRKENLRLVSPSQSGANRDVKSGQYRGVVWSKKARCWRVTVGKDNHNYHVGYFENSRHAAMAYDMWAKDLHGKYIVLNCSSLYTRN